MTLGGACLMGRAMPTSQPINPCHITRGGGMKTSIVKIVDNLLTVISVREMVANNLHIDDVQKSLSNQIWIMDALRFLKTERNNGADITLAHSDWIDKVLS